MRAIFTKIIFITVIILLLSACREIMVTTKINADGSFTRFITITGDSADLYKSGLPYPIDDTWSKEYTYDTLDSTSILIYKKNYKSSDMLNNDLQTDTSWMRDLTRSIVVDKRFGFFYSYLTFKETIQAANPFTLLDYKDFLSREDMQWIKNEKIPVTKSDSVKMEQASDKALEYIFASFTKELVQTIEKGVHELNDPSLRPEVVQQFEDSIQSKLTEGDYKSYDVFIDFMAEWDENPTFLNIKTNSPTLFLKLDADYLFFNHVFEMENYRQNVEMPGIITNTNALSVKGNSVSWDVCNEAFLFTDYTMLVESRVVNYWMFALTGFLALLLIIFLMIKAFK